MGSIADGIRSVQDVWQWAVLVAFVAAVAWGLLSACADTKHVGDSTDWGTLSKQVKKVDHD